MYELKSKFIKIALDESNGETTAIFSAEDKDSVNYIIPNIGWGTVNDFDFESVDFHSEAVTVTYRNKKEKLLLEVKKYIQDNDYMESYIVRNYGERDFFLTRDNFGIKLPFSCNYKRGTNIVQNNTINHIWCGGNSTYIKSQRLSSEGKHLWTVVVDGSSEDYSIIYPKNMPITDYRGIFVIHISDAIILPAQTRKITLKYSFDNIDIPPCDIVFSADKYTGYQNEEIGFKICSKNKIKSIEFNEDIEYTQEDNCVVGKFCFTEYGEKKIIARINDKKTHILINVIPQIKDILISRAKFIVSKQQMHCKGSKLDGAYLIYDKITDSVYYSSSFCDSNASRERISMGVVVACALQEKFDEQIYQSLKEHRKFIEREIYDVKTSTVYNEVGRNNDWERLYNYPWLSTYYFEWYNFNRERQCLLNATNILLRYYEVLNGAKQESVCMETYRIILELKKIGELELYERLYKAFINHCDKIIFRAGETGSEEVSWANGMVSAMVQYLSQAYLLCDDKKYLDTAKKMYKYAKVFYCNQPDYHLNSIAVRYWDGFWFGKIKCYGDTFPQWLSSLSGLMCYWYQKASGTDLKYEIENNLKGALCLYERDGYAASCYLYPYSVTIDKDNNFQAKDNYVPGIHYGKCYDNWANDQDWALYYAWLLID